MLLKLFHLLYSNKYSELYNHLSILQKHNNDFSRLWVQILIIIIKLLWYYRIIYNQLEVNIKSKLLLILQGGKVMSDLKEVLMEKDETEKSRPEIPRVEGEPTAAFKGASWAALLIGVSAYFIGLFNAGMELNEKGYYFAVLVFGLYAAVSLQKAVRDKEEGVPVTNIYYGISWLA